METRIIKIPDPVTYNTVEIHLPFFGKEEKSIWTCYHYLTRTQLATLTVYQSGEITFMTHDLKWSEKATDEKIGDWMVSSREEWFEVFGQYMDYLEGFCNTAQS